MSVVVHTLIKDTDARANGVALRLLPWERVNLTLRLLWFPLSNANAPGRTVVPSIGMAAKLSEIKPDKVYLSSCLVGAVPGCPYTSAQDLADIIKEKTGIDVVMGTHDYH